MSAVGATSGSALGEHMESYGDFLMAPAMYDDGKGGVFLFNLTDVDGAGAPDACFVGGTLTKARLDRVQCRNRTTGQVVLLPLAQGATSWDCESAGLVVNPGDKVVVNVNGTNSN
jgi:hypothetical protein